MATNEIEFASVVEFETDVAVAEAPQPLPDGTYPFEITKAARAMSKTSGKMMWAVTVTVKPDDFPVDYPPENNPNGVSVTTYIMQPETAKDITKMFMLKMFLQQIGAPMGKAIDCNDWVGRTGSALIGSEMSNNGIMMNRLVRIV